jgi:hypothetical protein
MSQYQSWNQTQNQSVCQALATMSAAMLKQMMEEAGAFLKDEKYQQALDSSRRVSQFDANNFQALMCVGVASFHLKQVRVVDAPSLETYLMRVPGQWEDSENALRRAADLKPDLPAPWKVCRHASSLFARYLNNHSRCKW